MSVQPKRKLDPVWDDQEYKEKKLEIFDPKQVLLFSQQELTEKLNMLAQRIMQPKSEQHFFNDLKLLTDIERLLRGKYTYTQMEEILEPLKPIFQNFSL